MRFKQYPLKKLKHDGKQKKGRGSSANDTMEELPFQTELFVITVKALNGDLFLVPCDETDHIIDLKKKLLTEVPEWGNHYYMVMIRAVDGVEARNEDPIDRFIYLLSIDHSKLAGFEIIYEDLYVFEYAFERFVKLLPSSETWHNLIENMERFLSTIQMPTLPGDVIVLWWEHLLIRKWWECIMDCRIVLMEDGSWKKQIVIDDYNSSVDPYFKHIHPRTQRIIHMSDLLTRWDYDLQQRCLLSEEEIQNEYRTHGLDIKSIS